MDSIEQIGPSIVVAATAVDAGHVSLSAKGHNSMAGFGRKALFRWSRWRFGGIRID